MNEVELNKKKWKFHTPLPLVNSCGKLDAKKLERKKRLEGGKNEGRRKAKKSS